MTLRLPQEMQMSGKQRKQSERHCRAPSCLGPEPAPEKLQKGGVLELPRATGRHCGPHFRSLVLSQSIDATFQEGHHTGTGTVKENGALPWVWGWSLADLTSWAPAPSSPGLRALSLTHHH